ncbi:hypothetical protein KUTeg_010301 [Tegillarca granosa]|uniref:Uncharacterized protein n=1 Tax=Tegillarca granosa TaxID=220873 RepID=A0ABQ9FBA7_TEGGR|nr:hypothetical protein KUTeg_010301 [Tegillarca granosa]
MLALSSEQDNQSNLLSQVLQLIDPALKFENQFQEIEYRAKTPVKHWALLKYDGPRYATKGKKLKSAFLLEGVEDKRMPNHGGSWRLIHDLTYLKGSSVNDNMDEKNCSVKYTSFEMALSLLTRIGRGLAARLDVKSAFR